MIDIPDDIKGGEETGPIPAIKTYSQRVMEYLQEHLKDDVILHMIYSLEPLNEDDVRTLERIFWQ